MSQKQRTIRRPFTFRGKGLHTGLDITLTLRPAPENHGIKITRVDLPGKPVIDALAENVDGTTRGTVIKRGDVQVSTIEHALSALYALGVDNCLLEVDAPEFPILDGSARAYVEAIQEADIEEQAEDRDYFIVRKRIEYGLPDSGSRIVLLPDDHFSIDVHIGFKSRILSNQFATLSSLEQYKEEIADARTFVFVREIQPLLGMGLIKGGDLDNAIVIYDEPMAQEALDLMADSLHQSRHDASRLGYITPLKHENEPARHKLLDVIGDLSLIGKPIQGKVIAYYPGHKVNTETAKLVRRMLRHQEVQPPVYDDTRPPVLDVNAIRRLLPHRWPMLLVDKVIDIRDKVIVGIKNVSGNEAFFVGHFPDEPVMPGVLVVEALAQCGGMLVLNKLEDPEAYSTYFLKLDNVKFRRKVVPGDTLVFRVQLLTEIRRGIATMRGLAFVGGQVVCEAEFTAQIAKNRG